MTEFSCFYCGCTEGPFHDEHVVPRSRGGPDTPHNLVKACARCNFSKRDKLPSEWLDVVPAAVAEIEARVCKSVGDKITARRNGSRRWAESRRRAADCAHCYFCSGPIDNLGDAFLELCDQEAGPPYLAKTHVRFMPNGGREERGSIAYPGNGPALVEMGKWTDYRRTGILSHAACGPDIAYWISLDRLLTDAQVGEWDNHLSGKDWGRGVVGFLRVAQGAAAKCKPRTRRAG